nr:hypothetical protein BaRGS_014849 [Batillaria attramentaria]
MVVVLGVVRLPVKKPRKKKPPSERPKKPKPPPKQKPKVWKRVKNPRKKLGKIKKEGEEEGASLGLGGHEEDEEDETGLTDTQIMQRELEKIPESMKQLVKRFDWSIGTFHGAVHLFSTAIVEHLMPQTIRWPSTEDEVKRCLTIFEQNYNFQELSF